MGGSGGNQGSNNGTMRIATTVNGAPTEITYTESPPKNTSVVGG